MNLGILLLLLAATQAKGEWATYHGGFSLDGATGAKLPAEPERLWRFNAGEPVEFTPAGFSAVRAEVEIVAIQGDDSPPGRLVETIRRRSWFPGHVRTSKRRETVITVFPRAFWPHCPTQAGTLRSAFGRLYVKSG